MGFRNFFCFVLILILAVSFFSLSMSFTHAVSSGPVLSVVLSGTINDSTLPTVAVGSTFSVDVRIDNTGSVNPGINSISFTLTWNPAVLQCINAADGTFLPNQSNSGDRSPDNNVGNVTYGLSVLDASNPMDCEPGGSTGVVATVTFQVLESAQSGLNIVPSSQNVVYLTYPNGSGNSLNVTNTQIVDALFNQMLTSINVYQLNTSNSTIQFPYGTDPIYNTFTVDVNITNAAAEPIWAWSIGVYWNPQVLQLDTITQGNYLTNVGGLYDGSPTLFIAGPIDNTAGPFPVDNVHGTIDQGISDVYLSNTTTTKLSGSLCILTFQVISYGNSYINITTGNPTLIDNLGNSQPVVLNEGQYVGVTPPPPKAPTAIIHNEAATTSFLPGATITLDAFSSTPGSDVTPNPNTPNFPILSYTWAVSGISGFTIPSSGSSITFLAPNPASSFLVTLTVSTAPNPADPNYVSTDSASIEFDPAYQQLTSAGAQIDLYIVNPNPTNTSYPIKFPTSQGIYNNTSPTGSYVDTFSPEEELDLQTFIVYNGAAVPNTLVTFVVTPENNPSDVLANFVAYSNDNGYATATYRLPTYNDADMPFGNYTVTAFVDIAQVRVSDCFTFQFNYVLNIYSVTQPPETARGQQTSFTATIQCNSFIEQNYFLSWTLTDSNNVPIISGETSGTAFPGSGNIQYVTLTIPTYSYNGTATLHVNLFNGNPEFLSQDALPYCPESDQSLTILP